MKVFNYQYPIFKIPICLDKKEELFLNIIFTHYYRKLEYFNTASNLFRNSSNNLLKKQLELFKFDTPLEKTLFTNLFNSTITIDEFAVLIETFSFDTLLNNFIYSVIGLILEIDVFGKINLSYENPTIKLPTFYEVGNSIIVRFANIIKFVPAEFKTNSIFEMFKYLAGQELLDQQFVRAFHLNASIKEDFETFSIFELAALIDNENPNIIISEIKHLDLIYEILINKFTLLDFRYSPYLMWIIRYLINITEDTIIKEKYIQLSCINNNMNKYSLLNNEVTHEEIADLEDDATDSAPEEDSEDPPVDDPEEDSKNQPSEGGKETGKEVSKKSLTSYIKFNLSLVADDETLEDFLYKLTLYKQLYQFTLSKKIKEYPKNTIAIVKDWLSKWIFLTSLSETNKLIHELKIKI